MKDNQFLSFKLETYQNGYSISGYIDRGEFVVNLGCILVRLSSRRGKIGVKVIDGGGSLFQQAVSVTLLECIIIGKTTK